MELYSSKYLQGLALLFICASVEYTVNGIQCYDCNSGDSYNKSVCDTLANPSIFAVNCTTNSNGVVYTRCRKTVQTVQGETRVIRSCATNGTKGGSNCVDRIGTKDVKIKYCECLGDFCNSSTAFLASMLLVAIGYAIANAAKIIL